MTEDGAPAETLRRFVLDPLREGEELLVHDLIDPVLIAVGLSVVPARRVVEHRPLSSLLSTCTDCFPWSI